MVLKDKRSRYWFQGSLIFSLLLLSFLIAAVSVGDWVALWPSIVALGVVLSSRRAFLGLLVGSLCGAILLAGGNFLSALGHLWGQQFLPIFSAPWKVGALLFTLVLGGFVALVEAGGGLQALIRALIGSGNAGARRMQSTVFGFGLLVFFDGLANTMLIGRLLRSAADCSGVSRVKLAYLADTTGSAVACLAFISTWIAFQLAMIREGYAALGMEVNAYALFFKSLPMNFYCWFALAMALLSVFRGFNPGPMAGFEQSARNTKSNINSLKVSALPSKVACFGALFPILVLVLSVPVFTYWLGAEKFWPFSLSKFANAYAVSENHVPAILVGSGLLASLVAGVWLFFGKSSVGEPPASVGRVFLGGVGGLLGPLAVLLAAWMLGAAISELGASNFLSNVLADRVSIALIPALIFLSGAMISFSTGTSWGTMAVLMPLAIPLVFGIAGEMPAVEIESFVLAAIGAVFSGAVFGDHCSPFSDTTIVASIAAGVEPLEHFRTQLPFAVLTGLVALFCGFFPLGFGLSPAFCFVSGLACLLFLPLLYTKAHVDSA
ncbi:MAG: Malate-2H(+)/Na(+)-lactate antiporter [Opitutia bacterium UBA7350]|nr:MAG: Malate-2H(+)/Na(+)-lactate antiporter [Opitutae bacterium UBA7350]